MYLMKRDGEYRLLGKTLDDAAGEAFDKGAKMLGLGFPGGPLIDQLAQKGNPAAISFPRPDPKRDSFDFSFSGLKTSLKYYLNRRNRLSLIELGDIAASYQQAIIDTLVNKCMSATRRYDASSLAVVGGVAANSTLRGTLKKKCDLEGISILIPSPALCTDNGAMISAAAYRYYRGSSLDTALSLRAFAHFPIIENRVCHTSH